MNPELVIPIHDLDAGGKQLRFPIRAEWLRQSFAAVTSGEEGDRASRAAPRGEDVRPGGSDGELEVRVSKSGNDVVVHGRLVADLEVACARCLQPARVHVDQPISALMVPAASLRDQAADDEEEGDGEDADVLPYHGDTVVLDDLVRDELLLAVPMIPLCSADCPGISPGPGTRTTAGTGGSSDDADTKRGIDPRLAPLLRIRPNQKE